MAESDDQPAIAVETDDDRDRRFVGWLIFSGMASVVTVGWVAWTHNPWGWGLVSGGDLITVGFVLAMGAVGDLLVRRTTKLSTEDLVRVGFTLLLIAFGGLAYGEVTDLNNDPNESKWVPGVWTLAVFALNSVFAATNVWAKEV